MSLEQALTPHRLAIGLPVRNVAPHLPRLLDVLIEVASACMDVRIVMAENDSDDATAEVAATLVKLDRRVSLLRFPGLQELVPERTDRLAFLRNSIVEELVALTDHEDGWTLVMLDADEVTSALTSAQVFELVTFLDNHPEYCGATANSQPVYYDVWTLRCDGWSPDDCWSRVDGRPENLSLEEAMRIFIAARQRPIDSMHQPIAVASAFGGLAAYHLGDVAQCRYGGHSSSGEPCSDHVPMNAELTELTGKPLAIVPSVSLIAPTEHIVEAQLSGQSHNFLDQTDWAVRRAVTSIATAGKRIGRTLVARSGVARRRGQSRQLTQRSAIDEYRIFMGADDALPRVAEEFRAYGRPVRSIGLALHRAHGRRIRAIDVGAKIGDATVALVVAAGADVLAIEGDDRYLGSLRDNTAPVADRVTIFSGFVTSDGAAIATLALGNVLTQAGWDKADLLRSNTDRHDFGIVQASLEFSWKEQPVLFFKFDPSLDAGGAEAGLAVVEEALLRGYRRWYVWDNFGNLVGQIENDQLRWFRNLVSYLAHCREAGGGLLYVDVAAFCEHHPRYDGAVELRPDNSSRRQDAA